MSSNLAAPTKPVPAGERQHEPADLPAVDLCVLASHRLQRRRLMKSAGGFLC
ncbi:MAG: hypothetical protein KA712_14880 [Myxococcales bacterium]|nr:hypothetical protein [Myxococcales bacterium]